jgi:hypothetical protein
LSLSTPELRERVIYVWKYTRVESLPDDHPLDERLFLYSTAKLMYPPALSDVKPSLRKKPFMDGKESTNRL